MKQSDRVVLTHSRGLFRELLEPGDLRRGVHKLIQRGQSVQGTPPVRNEFLSLQETFIPTTQLVKQ